VTAAAGDGDVVCAVCHRASAGAMVCGRCRLRMAGQLADLPSLRNRLRLALVPGPGGGGERLPSPKGEAPMPARMAALTLLAGGSDDARCLFVPAVRIWTTVETTDAGQVRLWHRELMRDRHGRLIMALVDDQSGVLPVRDWLRAWALEWRHTLGHVTDDHRPVPVRAAPPDRAAGDDDDPVAREWGRRWPETEWGPASQRHHAYLSAWLPQACERVPHIADFAASLRTLIGAVRSALDDIEDLEYIGRCPEEIEDHTTGTTGLCGAQIWHDPYASVITCPRCHAETGRDKRIWLARRILDAWPIDRRRRYPRGLIEVLRLPTCESCGTIIAVEWIDATERADREPFWRPGTFTCPQGCEQVPD
jgi:hypothetical protein